MSSLSVPQQHAKRIALSTLKLSRMGAAVMGGMDHVQAARFLLSIGYSRASITTLLLNAGHSEEECEGYLDSTERGAK